MKYNVKTLYEKGKSQRAIARELKIYRKTVRRIIEKIQKEGVKEAEYKRQKKLCEYEQIIKEKLEKGLNAKIIWQELKNDGEIDVSYPTVSKYVKILGCSEMFVPLRSLPAEETQVDFGHLGRFVKDGKLVKVWRFAMVLLYSRYENGSIIITTNRNYEDWVLVFGDIVLTSAIIDRLVHYGYIIKITGESYRIKNYRLKN